MYKLYLRIFSMMCVRCLAYMEYLNARVKMNHRSLTLHTGLKSSIIGL